MSLSNEQLTEMYRLMLRVRLFEEGVARLLWEDRFCGVGAEIAAQISEAAFHELAAPVTRLGGPFSPVPFSPPLEDAWLPNAARIKEAVQAAV